jgi:hypothetical protein
LDKLEKSWEEEKGIDDEENFDDDMGGRSSLRGTFKRGGDASRDFSNQ